MRTDAMRYAALEQYGLCTVGEAAGLRGVTVQTVRNWVRAGRLRVVIVGGGEREVWLLDRRQVMESPAPPKGRRSAAERALACSIAPDRQRVAAGRLGIRARGLGPAGLSLARRLVDGDESARGPLIDRLMELGRDAEAERVRLAGVATPPRPSGDHYEYDH
jgi:excisionase family DNA binding protein